MKRGQLNKKILNIWYAFTEGDEIDQADLKFFAYLDFNIKNEKRLKYDSMQLSDIDCMCYLMEKKYIKVEKIKDNTEDWRVTYIDKEFYMILQEILYISYVNI